MKPEDSSKVLAVLSSPEAAKVIQDAVDRAMTVQLQQVNQKIQDVLTEVQVTRNLLDATRNDMRTMRGLIASPIPQVLHTPAPPSYSLVSSNPRHTVSIQHAGVLVTPPRLRVKVGGKPKKVGYAG